MTGRLRLLGSVVSLVWLGLVLLTLMSWWLGVDHAIDDTRVTSVLLLLVAFTKVRFVGIYFMELRDAPWPLRFGYESWCAVVAATIVVLYLAS